MIHKKICKLCPAQFESHQPSATYCPKCRDRAKSTAQGRRWRQKHSHPCVNCGAPVSPKAERCRSCSHTDIGKRQRRENHPRWKGGRGYDSDGYIRLLSKEHHRANRSGYVYEHIAVWEDANGELPKGYVIHHLNGIRHDNRLSNLMAVQRGQHHYAIYLQTLQERIRDLEAELSQQRLC